jgi:hypothetical protein
MLKLTSPALLPPTPPPHGPAPSPLSPQHKSQPSPRSQRTRAPSPRHSQHPPRAQDHLYRTRTKCYQILEAASSDSFENTQANDTSPANDEFVFDPAALTDEDEEDDPREQDPDLMSSDPSEDEYDGDLDESVSCVRFTLQEILFYDDKISIFKARHGVI